MDPSLVSQSFLGPDSDRIFGDTCIGIVGLGGGGSHIAQQAAHVGIGGYVLADHDVVEQRNLNRLIGATAEDVVKATPKADVATRLIKSIRPQALVTARQVRWQDMMPSLRRCDVVFGCVDSFNEREQLERFARRFLIPYIDLGMDVFEVPGGFSIGGQVVLSRPGAPCLRCLGIVTDERITQEARLYGKAGGRPQVVWSNGVLASVAIGMLVQLLCPWHEGHAPICSEFDGNRNRVETNRADNAAGLICSHHQSVEVGDGLFKL